MFNPEKPVSLLFDACVAINKLCEDTGCGFGGLGWERSYTSNKKYMCQGDNYWCNNEGYHFCPYWSCVMGHMAWGYTLSPPSKALTAVKAPVISLYFPLDTGTDDFSAIGGFKTLVRGVGLILGACTILPCFLPLVIRSIRSIIEATRERKTAAHIMMLWKYKPLN
jgi:hypothetical protein